MKVFHLLLVLSLVSVSMACGPAQPSNGGDDLGHGNSNTGGGSSHEHGGKHGKSKGGKHGRRRSLQSQNGPGRENFEDGEGSLCADPATIGRLCMAGTSMGARMEAAVSTCRAQEPQVQVEVADRKGRENNKGKRGKGKAGNGKGGKNKCPSSNNIIEKINNEMAEQQCIMNEMGWVDEEGNMSYQVEAATTWKMREDIFKVWYGMEDLKSLNPSIMENIDAEDVKNCQKKARAAMRKNIFNKKCKDKYSEEDRSKIDEIIKDVVSSKCSFSAFIKSCSKYVASTFVQFVAQAVGPREV